MTLTDIREKLLSIAISIEKYPYEFISEELMCLADDIQEIENDVVGTIAGISQALKDYEKKKNDTNPFSFYDC